MSALNPERVFHIQHAARDGLRRRWHARLDGARLRRSRRRRSSTPPTPSFPAASNLYESAPSCRRRRARRAPPTPPRSERTTRPASASRPRPSSSTRRDGHYRVARRRRRGDRVHRHLSRRHDRGARRPTRARSCPPSASPASGRSSAAPRTRHHSAWSTTSRPTPATASSPCCRTSTPAASPTTPSTTPACAAQLGSTPFLPERLAQGAGRARRQEALPEPLDRQPRTDVARLHAARARGT